MTWSTPDGRIFVGTDPPAGSKQLGIYYPRSGTLGGCAAHNAMVAVLPPNEDWDFIAELTKDDSWRAKNMRHLFKHLERNNYLPKDSQLHGFDGWFETNLGDHSAIDAAEPVVSAALSVATGHRPPPNNPLKGVVKDINGHDPESRDGVYHMPMHMTGEGKRSSPRDFLVATANAKNAHGGRRYPLFVRTHSFATRILFDDHQRDDRKPKAVGIEYFEGQSLYQADPRWTKRYPGVKKRAYAAREVIISCGVFNTPQLLKLSGIGPKDELERLNIDVVVDLPGVGRNLQDNYEYSVVSKAQDASLSSLTKSTLLTAGDPLLEQWIRTGKGPYASNAIPFAVLHTSTEAENDQPDIFMFGGAINFTGFFPGMSAAALVPSDWTWDILKIRSRNDTGTVTLRSANPFERPEINFNYFPTWDGNAKDTEKDLEAMKQGAELARRINKEIKGSAAPFTELQPGADVTSDAAIKQSIRNDTFGHHASCTVAIGPGSSEMACLDSQFRVRGVEGLRVVDASSFPRVVGSFPTMTIAILAEKATDVILQDVSRVDGSDKVLDGVR
jgi:choline dehydrogenase